MDILVKLLYSKDETVQSRVLGVIHNLSSDLEAVPLIRSRDGIPAFLALLLEYVCIGCCVALFLECGFDFIIHCHSKSKIIVATAAGCVQNMSREEESRIIIRSLDGVEILTNLLFSNDAHTQASAAQALMNVSENECVCARDGQFLSQLPFRFFHQRLVPNFQRNKIRQSTMIKCRISSNNGLL